MAINMAAMRSTSFSPAMVALIAAAVVSQSDLTHSSLIKGRDDSQGGAAAVVLSLPTYLEGEIRSFYGTEGFYGYRVAGGSGRQMKVGKQNLYMYVPHVKKVRGRLTSVIFSYKNKECL